MLECLPAPQLPNPREIASRTGAVLKERCRGQRKGDLRGAHDAGFLCHFAAVNSVAAVVGSHTAATAVSGVQSEKRAKTGKHNETSESER